jgi:hypothetical protein
MGESMWRRPVTELSSYPTELDAHVTLTDQRRVRIRALYSREERPIRVLHARLSTRSRYLRFLSPIPTLPDALRIHAGPNPYGRQGTRTRFAGNGLTTMVEGRSR